MSKEEILNPEFQLNDALCDEVDLDYKVVKKSIRMIDYPMIQPFMFLYAIAAVDQSNILSL